MTRPQWVEIPPAGWWASWMSCHDSGLVLGGSGATFVGTLPDGSTVARTYDGREWVRCAS